MTIVRRTSPFGELMSLRQAMDRLFEDSFVRPGRVAGAETGIFPIDVRATGDALVLEAALPGTNPDDVSITVEGGTLTISAHNERESRGEEGDWLIQEIRRGSLTRTIALPEGLEPDKATAEFEHGVLTLRIPRAEAVKPRQIRITPAGSAGQTGEHPSVEGGAEG